MCQKSLNTLFADVIKQLYEGYNKATLGLYCEVVPSVVDRIDNHQGFPALFISLSLSLRIERESESKPIIMGTRNLLSTIWTRKHRHSIEACQNL